MDYNTCQSYTLKLLHSLNLHNECNKKRFIKDLLSIDNCDRYSTNKHLTHLGYHYKNNLNSNIIHKIVLDIPLEKYENKLLFKTFYTFHKLSEKTLVSNLDYYHYINFYKKYN